jgi:hypothetical protein
MNSNIYFGLLAAVLVTNAALSFYYAGIAKENHDHILGMLDFQRQGARYTYDDGVRDRADRDRMIAEVAERIEALEEKP